MGVLGAKDVVTSQLIPHAKHGTLAYYFTLVCSNVHELVILKRGEMLNIII